MTSTTEAPALPQPDVSPVRAGARWARRAYLRRRRDSAVGEARKRLNAELNWREFWHGRLRLASYPRVVQIGTNWTCNLKCNFCTLTMDWFQAGLAARGPGRLAVSDRVEAVAGELLPYAEILTLTPLGEPLLWPGLGPLLERHAALGCRNLGLTTNGLLLKEGMAERLVRGQLAALTVSIDSNDPEIYAGMRVGGELRRVEAGLRRVNDWKARLGVPWPTLLLAGTFMRRNIGQLPAMVGWAKGLGFEDFKVQLMEIVNPEHAPEFLGRHVGLARRCVTEALEEARRVGLRLSLSLGFRSLLSAEAEGRPVEIAAASEAPAAGPVRAQGVPGTAYVTGEGHPDGLERAPQDGKDSAGDVGSAVGAGPTPLDPTIDLRGRTLIEKCSRPWYFLLIDTDGEVRPCCWSGGSWGNFNRQSWEEVWNGAEAQAMRRRFLDNYIPFECRGKHCRVDL